MDAIRSARRPAEEETQSKKGTVGGPMTIEIFGFDGVPAIGREKSVDAGKPFLNSIWAKLVVRTNSRLRTLKFP